MNETNTPNAERILIQMQIVFMYYSFWLFLLFIEESLIKTLAIPNNILSLSGENQINMTHKTITKYFIIMIFKFYCACF